MREFGVWGFEFWVEVRRRCAALALLTQNSEPKTQNHSGSPEIGGIEFITDQQKIQAGHLDILHGHELGKGSIAPPVNPARGFFLKTMECTLAGHLHRSSTHRERSSKGKQIACWSTACLCGLYPDYARINKWNQGGARVDLHGDDFAVTLLDIINGKVM